MHFFFLFPWFMSSRNKTNFSKACNFDFCELLSGFVEYAFTERGDRESNWSCLRCSLVQCQSCHRASLMRRRKCQVARRENGKNESRRGAKSPLMNIQGRNGIGGGRGKPSWSPHRQCKLIHHSQKSWTFLHGKLDKVYLQHKTRSFLLTLIHGCETRNKSKNRPFYTK